MKYPIIVVLILCVSVRCPAQQPTATKPTAPHTPRTTSTSISISALTAETYDQIYNIVSFSDSSARRRLTFSGTYGNTKTRVYYGNVLYRSEVNAYTFDVQYRADKRRSYNFVNAAGSVTHVSPGSSYYPDTTGYYSVSVGVGRSIVPGLDGEIGLGHVRVYEDGTETSLIPVYALRLKKDLASNITLDGNLRMLQPFSQDTFADSRTSLTYRFTRSVGLQLTYVANNLLVPATSRTGWNRTFRVMLTFSHSRTR